MVTKQYLRGLTNTQLDVFNWFKRHPEFKLLVDYSQITIKRNYYPVECMKCGYGKNNSWKPRLDILMYTNHCPNESRINRIYRRRKLGFERYRKWYLNTDAHNQITILNWISIRKEYFSNIKSDLYRLKHHKKGISPARHIQVKYKCNRCGYKSHKILTRLRRKFRYNKILCGHCASKAHTKRQKNAKLKEFKAWCHKPEVKKYVNVVGCKKLNKHNYHGQNTRVQSICQKCGYGSGTRKWYPTVQSLMDPRHTDICPKCAGTLKLIPKEVNFKISSRFKTPIYVHYDHSLPKGSNTPAKYICPIHNKKGDGKPSSILALLCGHGCSYCGHKFKNEINAKRVLDACSIPECSNKAELYKCKTGYLHSYSIPPDGHKMTDDYKHNLNLSIDFMLKINGKYYPIELDGLQHKAIVDFGGRVSQLRKKHASQEKINEAKRQNKDDWRKGHNHDSYKSQWAIDENNCAKILRIACYNYNKKKKKYTAANPLTIIERIYNTLFSFLKKHHVSGCPDDYYKLLNKISKDKLKLLPKHLPNKIVRNDEVYQLL